MKQHVRAGVALLTLFAILMSVFGAFAPQASAQGSVVGSADFRNAPQLPPGQFVDRIVTGDTAWYAVVYTNNTPYRFEVSFQGQDPGGQVDLTASFVAPTLTTVDGPGRLIDGGGVEYPSGHTNVWFLKVALDTSAQIGVEYPILINVEGVQTYGIEACADLPGCDLDDEYAAINVALAEAQTNLDLYRSQETTAGVQAEIENARGFAESSDTLGPQAQARLSRLEARLAELCDPEPDCEEFPTPGSKTPIAGWIVGLAAVAFGLRQAIKKFTRDPLAEEAAPPSRTTPGSSALAKKAAGLKKAGPSKR